MDQKDEVVQDSLLDDMLEVLIKRWGYQTVRYHLSRVSRRQESPSTHGDNLTRKRHRKTAVEYIEKLKEVDDFRRQTLLEFGRRFDKKEFLPTAADMREFLAERDLNWSHIRTREAAIPVVVRKLLTLSDDRLRRMLVDNAFSGPAQLGPLSEAIKESATKLR